MATPTASPTVSSTVGLKNMVIAPLTEDTEETVSYGTLQAVAGAIEATITPESADPDVQYADDVEFDTLYPDPEISFSTSMADIPLTIQEMIFGNQIDDNGVLVRTATDKPPYFAVGFMSEKANHKFRFIWLYKVRAKPMTETYKTKEGQTITRQNGSGVDLPSSAPMTGAIRPWPTSIENGFDASSVTTFLRRSVYEPTSTPDEGP